MGLWALLRQEFTDALGQESPRPLPRKISIATGTAAAPLLSGQAALAEKSFPGLSVAVYGKTPMWLQRSSFRMRRSCFMVPFSFLSLRPAAGFRRCQASFAEGILPTALPERSWGRSC